MLLYGQHDCGLLHGEGVIGLLSAGLNVVVSYLGRLHRTTTLKKDQPPPLVKNDLPALALAEPVDVMERPEGVHRVEQFSVFPDWVGFVQRGVHSSESIVDELQRFAQQEEFMRDVRYHQAAMEKMCATNCLELA